MSAPASNQLDESSLAGYLLGRLNEKEQERVEHFYFGDAQRLEHLLAAEDELIDSYVRGELDSGERERFENFFLRSHERRERLETARAFDIFIKKTSAASASCALAPTHTRYKRAAFWLPLAASLLLAAGCAFFVYSLLAQ
jgi:hypothetical protein